MTQLPISDKDQAISVALNRIKRDIADTAQLLGFDRMSFHIEWNDGSITEQPTVHFSGALIPTAPRCEPEQPESQEDGLPILGSLPDSSLLDSQQTADYLGLSVDTLSVWRSTGRYNLPFIKVGRLVRYRAGDLKAFLKSRAFTHTILSMNDGGR